MKFLQFNKQYPKKKKKSKAGNVPIGMAINVLIVSWLREIWKFSKNRNQWNFVKSVEWNI